jgi:hypothetical protein
MAAVTSNMSNALYTGNERIVSLSLLNSREGALRKKLQD